MPGVLKTDCRVKPEVRSFNRLGPTSRVASSVFRPLRTRRGKCHHRGGLMIFPWARVLISAGAHGLRRIPGQSVNLAHLIWRAPRAPAPLLSGNKVHPRWFSARGYGCWGVEPLQSLRDSFPTSGEAACPNCFRVPLPRFTGKLRRRR
jgi:hypothetical protein